MPYPSAFDHVSFIDGICVKADIDDVCVIGDIDTVKVDVPDMSASDIVASKNHWKTGKLTINIGMIWDILG